MTEPDNLVLQLLREMRGDIAGIRSDIVDIRATMATKDELADLRSEVHSLRADVASDLLTLEKRLSDKIAGLRRAVWNTILRLLVTACYSLSSKNACAKSSLHLNLPPDAH